MAASATAGHAPQRVLDLCRFDALATNLHLTIAPSHDPQQTVRAQPHDIAGRQDAQLRLERIGSRTAGGPSPMFPGAQRDIATAQHEFACCALGDPMARFIDHGELVLRQQIPRRQGGLAAAEVRRDKPLRGSNLGLPVGDRDVAMDRQHGTPSLEVRTQQAVAESPDQTNGRERIARASASNSTRSRAGTPQTIVTRSWRTSDSSELTPARKRR